MLERESLNVFSKTCRFSKVYSQWLSYTSVRNPYLNDDFWLFSNQGLVRSKTKSFSKSSSLNKRKRFQTQTHFKQNSWALFQDCSKDFSKSLKMSAQDNSLQTLNCLLKCAIIKGEFKNKMFRIHAKQICLSLQKSFP